ncbi:MAG: hypothetical protein ACRYGP_13970 [Janthinobacterium lividum]
MKWFWRLYLPTATVLLLSMLAAPFGPWIEGTIRPIRTDQRIEDVVRNPDRLCWTWVSIKVRDGVSDNMDVFLATRTDRMVVAVFERDTGLPWGRSRAVGLGPHRQSYCVLLPPNVRPSDAVRIEQVAYYPGLLGLWHLAVHFPDIVEPPDATVP